MNNMFTLFLCDVLILSEPHVNSILTFTFHLIGQSHATQINLKLISKMAILMVFLRYASNTSKLNFKPLFLQRVWNLL